MIESIDSIGISRPFYTGGEVVVGQLSGYIFSLYNGGVSVVDPSSGQTFAHIPADNDAISTFAVNPKNNSEIVTVGLSLLCRHWSISVLGEVTMVRAWNSNHLHTVSALNISHDGALLATSGVDKCIRVFSLSGYFPVAVYKVPNMTDPISMLKFHPTRLLLVSSGPDNLLHVWDLTNTARVSPLKELSGHMSTIQAISFSPDGASMMTSGNDQVVLTFDFPKISNDITLTSQVAVFESVHSVLALSRNTFVTAGDKGLIRVWQDRKCLVSKPSGHSAKGVVKHVLRLPDSDELVTVGEDLALSIWTKDISFIRQLAGNLGEIVSLKNFGDSKIVVAVNDEFPRIIDTSNFGSIARLEGHSDICLAVSVSREFIATGSKDQTIRIWTVAAPFACVAEFKGHTDAVGALAFTHNGSQLVSGSEDKCIKIWNLPKGKTPGKIVRSIMAHSKSVNCVALSGNDKYIASGSQDRTAKIFNLADGSLVGVCEGHKRGVWAVEFSPIEQLVATASGDCTVKLWNLAAAGIPCIRTFEGHEQAVLCTRFLPSGLQLVSSDALGIIRFWNVRNGECDLVALADGDSVVSNHLVGVSKKSQTRQISSKIEDFAESDDACRIWTFDLVAESPLQLITGTSGGTLSVWKDTTSERVEKRKSDLSEIAAKDTSIQVLVSAGKYSDAFSQAFVLNRGKQMLSILKTASWSGKNTIVNKFVKNLDPTEYAKLALMIAEWQKTARNCSIAYSIVSKLRDRCQVDAFDGFAEKHLARLCALAQKCYVIDAILIASNTDTPDAKRLKQ